MTVHHLEEVARRSVEGDRVRRRLEDDGRVLAVLVGLESATAVELGLGLVLSVVEAVGSLSAGGRLAACSAEPRAATTEIENGRSTYIMPHVDGSALERLSILTRHRAVEVSVVGSRLLLANDGRPVRLSGHTAAVEGTEDCRRGGVNSSLGVASVLEPVLGVRRRVSSVRRWRPEPRAHMSQRDSTPKTSETRIISPRFSVVILPASARRSQVATDQREGRETGQR